MMYQEKDVDLLQQRASQTQRSPIADAVDSGTGPLNWHLPGFAPAYAWLARDLRANLDLLLALLHDPLGELIVVGDAPRLRGVLLSGPHPTRHGSCIRLDAVDDQALNDLICKAAPSGDQRWLIQRPVLAAELTARCYLQPSGFGLHGYTCLRTSDVTPLGRLLSAEDETLVRQSDCGWSMHDFRHMLQFQRRPWAITDGGRIVCRASSGYGTPWTEEVIGLWTDPNYRSLGLAQRLVAAITNDILRRKPFATYTTTADNLPSQRVACGVGFELASTSLEYI